MFDFIPILEANPNGVLATQDGKKVRTRIFLYLFASGKRVYFCTNSQEPVFAELKTNPHAAFCTHAQNYEPVLTINGKAVFVEDMAVKERVLCGYPMLKEIYKSADNPVFKVFYMDVTEVETFMPAQGVRRYSV
jgi:uncharacterized pyridoxamine 5'-phosphate oxidase family protein